MWVVPMINVGVLALNTRGTTVGGTTYTTVSTWGGEGVYQYFPVFPGCFLHTACSSQEVVRAKHERALLSDT